MYGILFSWIHCFCFLFCFCFAFVALWKYGWNALNHDISSPWMFLYMMQGPYGVEIRSEWLKKRWCRLQSYNVNHHWRVLYLDIIYVYMCVYVYTDISIFIDILFLIHIMILIFYRQICLKCTIHRYCEERISSPMGFWVYTSYKCIHAQSWNNNIEIITN